MWKKPGHLSCRVSHGPDFVDLVFMVNVCLSFPHLWWSSYQTRFRALARRLASVRRCWGRWLRVVRAASLSDKVLISPAPLGCFRWHFSHSWRGRALFLTFSCQLGFCFCELSAHLSCSFSFWSPLPYWCLGVLYIVWRWALYEFMCFETLLLAFPGPFPSLTVSVFWSTEVLLFYVDSFRRFSCEVSPFYVLSQNPFAPVSRRHSPISSSTILTPTVRLGSISDEAGVLSLTSQSCVPVPFVEKSVLILLLSHCRLCPDACSHAGEVLRSVVQWLICLSWCRRHPVLITVALQSVRCWVGPVLSLCFFFSRFFWLFLIICVSI